MEQTFVESVLWTWARSCTRQYDQLIAELDRLLRTVSTTHVPLLISPDVHRYARVLRRVAQTSGRSPSFASCEDRINIGTALIHEARLRSVDESLAPDDDYITLRREPILGWSPLH